ncbi:MAG: DUF711 family protein, partial [Acidobacteria bacterium]|nr:DUF711 family protein [Acidobacteriota bacterium]
MKYRAIGTAVIALLGLFLCAACAAQAAENQKPKVRAVTAFIRIDRANRQPQFADALKVLRAMKTSLERAGYEVQSIRIVTQPFPEYTKGLAHQEALALLKELDQLAAKESFALNIGPAMLRDTDDAAAMNLLAEALSTTRELNASAIVAGDDGVHWNAVRAAA